jgi:hypothetical protein
MGVDKICVIGFVIFCLTGVMSAYSCHIEKLDTFTVAVQNGADPVVAACAIGGGHERCSASDLDTYIRATRCQ